MTDFYLITGFLGAGKTTFLKNFMLLFKGKNLRLIINEYGKEGVDGKLLEEIGATLKEISGGSIFCSCRADMFEEALNDGLETQPEILIVEASGLSDPTSIRAVTQQFEKQNKLNYKGCICLIDSVRFKKVLSTARVCSKQLAVADLALLNKIDLATTEQQEETKGLILERYPELKIISTSMGKVDISILDDLHPYIREEVGSTAMDITLQRASIDISEDMTLNEVEKFIKMFCEETSRIKGFIHTKSDGYLLVDCVGSYVKVEPWNGKKPDELVINVLATAGMDMRKTINYALKWYETKASVKFG